ncbi:MAG TPA: dihydrolipoamide acetyltransferase family protein [Pyrinomonadaceae bacterium]|nr:dihydrolipoamide acetyltransferase family protein [Pyrinomonadaceae bacterium]
MAEFVMPTLGADMTAGTLLGWMKKPGDSVKRGEIIAEVDTDKGVIEVEVFANGIIEKLLVAPGAEVPVGTVLAIISEEEKAIAAERPALTAPPIAPTPSKLPALIVPPVPTPSTGPAAPRIRVSPAARKLAAELGIELATVTGTGSGGRIQREDVERAAATKATTIAAPEQAERIARMRRTIGAAMSRSKREIPHYYLSTTIDMNRAMSWLAKENLNRPIADRFLYGVLLIKAVALALHEVPELNSIWQGDTPVPCSEINVGVAISLRQGGLVAPALRNVDKQSLDNLMKSLRDLVKRARTGSLRSSELSDSTITITSLGELGVETVYGIIYAPQVALVGFGKVVERPWSVGGQIVSRPTLMATLSADHRVSDGHRGGLFLSAIDRLLQEPGSL